MEAMKVCAPLQSPPAYLLMENVVGFEASSTADALRCLLGQQAYAVQEFQLSPTQLGLPYSRPRYFCLARKVLLPDGHFAHRGPYGTCKHCACYASAVMCWMMAAKAICSDGAGPLCSSGRMAAGHSHCRASWGCHSISRQRSCCGGMQQRRQQTTQPSVTRCSRSTAAAAHHSHLTGPSRDQKPSQLRGHAAPAQQVQLLHPAPPAGGSCRSFWRRTRQPRASRLWHLRA